MSCEEAESDTERLMKTDEIRGVGEVRRESYERVRRARI